MSHIEGAFSAIYRDNGWKYGSGGGSLSSAARPYTSLIKSYIEENNITCVLDIGCGDWQAFKTFDWSGISHIGLDVVGSVIELNQRVHAREGIRFERGDVLQSQLPSADLVLIKDVLQHLSNANIALALSRLSHFSQVIITNTTMLELQTVRKADDQTDIRDGGFRPLDVRMEPFGLECNELLTYTSRYPAVSDEGVQTELQIVDTKTVLQWVRHTRQDG